MSDVLITPASSKIEFKDASSNIDGTVKLDSDGNLELTSGNGISFGDVTSDVFIGNGTDNVDLKFEADGSITGTSGVTLTLGSSGSNISFGTNITSGLNVGGNITLTGLSSVTAGGGFYGALYGDVIYDDTTYRFAPTATGSVLHSSGGVQRFRINPSGAEVVGVLTASSLVADTLKSSDNVVMLTTKPGGSVSNVAIGKSALGISTDVQHCVAIGEEALSLYPHDTVTVGSIAIGYRALKEYTSLRSNGTFSGGNNIAIGENALMENKCSSANIAIGDNTLKELNKDRSSHLTVNGNRNIAVGTHCMTGNGVDDFFGSMNTAIGYYCAQNIRSNASYNTLLGTVAGQSLLTGDGNLLLGYGAGTSSSPATIDTEDNRIVLGNNSITDASIKVDWTVTSDKRDKTDIESFTHGLSWINKLNPVTYRWDMRSNYEDGIPDGSKKESQLNIGLIAQEELEVEKEHGYANTSDDMLISHINPGGSYGMQYSKLVPVLINAVKELSAKNDALEARIKALES